VERVLSIDVRRIMKNIRERVDGRDRHRALSSMLLSVQHDSADRARGSRAFKSEVTVDEIAHL
jgi:hypothetical protein